MASSSFASSTFQWKYDVFLSFKGEDTRKNFTDHLYYALNQKGVVTFRDNEGLERGKEISELLTAIEESRFSVIILSKNYASSTWCLDELDKILKCVDNKQHTAFPVFYDVDPSEVRKQTGDFKKAFDKHKKQSKEKVKKWKSALTRVANIPGWTSQDRHESQLIQEIVKEISTRLDQLFSSVANDLVGINPRVKEIVNNYLEVGMDDVRFIGIYGMGGIGKTTIARAIYEMLLDQYENRCFLANVREDYEKRGPEYLQGKLLSEVLKESNVSIWDVQDGIKMIRRQLRRKKVFLVLDDVNDPKQLKTLAKVHHWFGSGSRIVITTRNKHLLISHGVKNNHIYEVGVLKVDEALKLFHLKAFKHEKATVDHIKLSKLFIKYAQGLPLALEVLGSFLCNRSVKEWKSSLGRLHKHHDYKNIMKVLRLSYDGLAEIDKKIFLDIAYFFKGKKEEHVMKMLQYRFDSDQTIGIRELIDRSLIIISCNNSQMYNFLQMHDLLEEMGREIVREQHPDDPSKWSRLWLYEDIRHVLTNENMGAREVDGIMLDNPKKDITNLKGKSFSNMVILKLLKISNFHSSDEQLEYLSNELRYLKWHGYPFKSLPSSFNPENFYILDMCYSTIEYLSDSIKSLTKLKIIKLSHSTKLIRTLDFTKVPNLERLDLEGCISLLEVHQSVGLLQKLTVLNLKNCKKLESFPSSISGLRSLRILNLYGCSNLEKLPQDLGEAELLEELDVGGTAIREVPNSIVQLTKLKTLSFRGCKGRQFQTLSRYLQSLWMLKRHPASSCLRLPPLTGLSSVTKLDLGDCNILEGAIPNDLGSLSSLEELNLRGNNFVTLPESMKELLELKILCLEECQMLKSLPQLSPQLAFIGAEDCLSLETLPITLLEQFTSSDLGVHLINCPKLAENHPNLADMFLKLLLQNLSNDYDQFYVLLPGSGIPKWFTHWRNQSSIEIELPPNWLNDQFKGFVICAVFTLPTGYSSKASITGCCKIRIGNYSFGIRFGIPNVTRIQSDHLCLGFLSYNKIEKELGFHRYPSPNMTERRLLFPEMQLLFPGRHVHAEFGINDKFVSHNINLNTFVKRCGIRPVYTQDVEYFGIRQNFEELPEAKGSIIELSHDNSGYVWMQNRQHSTLTVLHDSLIRRYFYSSMLWTDDKSCESDEDEE